MATRRASADIWTVLGLASVSVAAGCGSAPLEAPPGAAASVDRSVYLRVAEEQLAGDDVAAGFTAAVDSADWIRALRDAPSPEEALAQALRSAGARSAFVETRGTGFCARASRGADCMLVRVFDHRGERLDLSKLDLRIVEAIVYVEPDPAGPETRMAWRAELRTARLFFFVRLPDSGGLRSGVMAGVVAAQAGPPPDVLLGPFEDDYGARYEITDSTWQHGSSLYRVVSWNPDERYLVLTGSDRDGSGVDWLRIDWLVFGSGANAGPVDAGAMPWIWAHCIAIWDAESEASARAAPSSDRGDPRSGCGEGFPFSRMRPSTPR